MARDNVCIVQGDITGDIYYDVTRLADGRMMPFLRVYMMIDGSHNVKPVPGLRIMFYGRLAREVEAHVRKGSRISVEGHIRRRDIVNPDGKNQIVFEIVAENIEYIKNINWLLGRQRIQELNLQEGEDVAIQLDETATLACNLRSSMFST